MTLNRRLFLSLLPVAAIHPPVLASGERRAPRQPGAASFPALRQRSAARAGDMAALPLLKRFGVSEAARASAYVYSTTNDIDRLVQVLMANP